MKKSGLADSPFFAKPSLVETVVTPPIAKSISTKVKVKKPKSAVTPRHHDTKPPRHHDTMPPSNHGGLIPESYGADIERIRKTVKEVGKEAATHRFTIAEKRAIKKILFKYENNGILTSENEITRIAVNFVVEDYAQHGENSLLAKVLQALNE
jgi:hypothetical protein